MKNLLLVPVLVLFLTGVGPIPADAQPIRPIKKTLTPTFTCVMPTESCGGGTLTDLAELRFWARQNGGPRMLLQTVGGVMNGQTLDVVPLFPNEGEKWQGAYEAVDTTGTGSFDCSPVLWSEEFDIQIPPAQCGAPVLK